MHWLHGQQDPPYFTAAGEKEEARWRGGKTQSRLNFQEHFHQTTSQSWNTTEDAIFATIRRLQNQKAATSPGAPPCLPWPGSGQKGSTKSRKLTLGLCYDLNHQCGILHHILFFRYHSAPHQKNSSIWKTLRHSDHTEDPERKGIWDVDTSFQALRRHVPTGAGPGVEWNNPVFATLG